MLRPVLFRPLPRIRDRRQRGLSLIEMSVVLMVMGLMLVGIVKGQELVQNSRVHSTIATQDGFMAAVLAFHDRFRQYPGDYDEAVVNIALVQHDGNGDGRIDASATVAGPNGVAEENVLAWDHLAKAGFIQGGYIFHASNPNGAIPKNAFGGYVDLTFDSVYGHPGLTGSARHTLKTGNQMPVDIIAEMDRKIDDGNAFAGAFRFSAFARTGSVPDASGGPGACTAANGGWITNTAVVAVNCGAATLL